MDARTERREDGLSLGHSLGAISPAGWALLIVVAFVGLAAGCNGGPKSDAHAKPQIAATEAPLLGPGGLNCGAAQPVSYGTAWANKVFFTNGASEGLGLMNPDGTAVVRLYNGEVLGYDVSADGRHITFSSSPDGNRSRAIYVLDDGGGSARAITVAGRFDLSASWSPDARRIAFASGPFNNREVWVVNADGTNPTRLAAGADPVWSPTGGCIAFTSTREGGRRVFIMDATGATQTRLTSGTETELNPRWSPDGRRLSFNCGDDLCVAAADGSGLKKLTKGTDAAWSPDGKRLAYTDALKIYVVNIADTMVTKLIENGTMNGDPTWSMDGRRVFFGSVRGCGPCPEGADKYNGIHATSADAPGGTPDKTFIAPGFDPVWSPIPKK